MAREKTPLQLLREALSQKPKSDITTLLLTREPHEIKEIPEKERVAQLLKKLEEEVGTINLSIPTVPMEIFFVKNWGISGLGGYVGNVKPIDSKICLKGFIQKYVDYLEGRIEDEAYVAGGKYLMEGLYSDRWITHVAA